MIQSPCKNCSDRHIKCHSSCEKWLAYRKEFEAEKARIVKEKSIYLNILEAEIERKTKEKKKKRSKSRK